MSTYLSHTESLLMLENMFDNTPVGMAITDTKGSILKVNPSYCRITGYNETELRQINYHSLTHPDDRALNDKKIEEMLTKQFPGTTLEKRYIRKDGQPIWVSVSISLYKDPKGSPANFLKVVQDITKEKEASIREKETQFLFKALLENMPQMAWTALPWGKLKLVNKRWREFTGLDLEQSPNWLSVFHPEDAPMAEKIYRNALTDLKPCSFEARIKRKHDGCFLWHLVEALPLRNAKGEVTLWVGTATNIEKLKKAQQEREIFYLLAEQSPEFITLVDLDGMPTYSNQAAVDIIGAENIEQMLHTPTKAFFFAEDQHFILNEFLPRLQQEDHLETEIRFRHFTTHQPIWMLYSVVALRHPKTGEFQGHATISRNIHQRKLAQDALRKSNLELKKVNADLDNFIYTASHDLKAPVLNIEGLVYVLNSLLNKKGGQDEDISKYIRLMYSSINRFKETILDLTEISKIQKNVDGEVELIDICSMIKEVKESIESYIQEAQAEIVLDEKKCPAIQFSKHNLRSIIYNLLTNAIKYRHPDRKPQILIQTDIQNSQPVLKVKDNGLGVKPEQKEKMFKMFKRLHTHVEGTGIGLYIVKRIIDNTGGRIEVDSQEGLGTEFRVYFGKKE
jgi:PAS domain S-box-containing protein